MYGKWTHLDAFGRKRPNTVQFCSVMAEKAPEMGVYGFGTVCANRKAL